MDSLTVRQVVVLGAFLVLLALCWPARTIRVRALALLSWLLRGGLFAGVAVAGLIAVAPHWASETWRQWVQSETFVQPLQHLDPAWQWLAGAAALVAVAVPLLSLVDLARNLSVATRKPAVAAPPVGTRSAANVAGRVEPRDAVAVPQRELQSALDAMTRSSSEDPRQARAKKTLADVV